jgi:hypothetical protein
MQNLWENLESGFRSTFLPSGFPTKTPDGYLRYAVWGWVQDLSTQLRGVLATQRILEGVGVGKQGATALSALLNFLVRDGCGMLASLTFTTIAAPSFRSDVKRWRLFADIIVDVGITLEVMAIQMPTALFLPLISLGNACKAMCGVAAGACSGPINLHWAQGSDISDISAKFGAQNTVTGALGIIFAAFFARSVSTLPLQPLWILYSALTILHIHANRRCMRLIAFESFNTLRLNMVLSHFFQEYDIDNNNETTSILLPTPKQIARQEPLLFSTILKDNPTHPIHVGVSFNEFVNQAVVTTTSTTNTTTTNDVSRLLHLVGTENEYWITVLGTTATKRRIPLQLSTILVALPEDSDSISTTKAYFHAYLLNHLLMKYQKSDNPSVVVEKVQDMASQHMQASWKCFQNACIQAGWNLDQTELKSKGFEVSLQPL